jgi:hypothetical protein
MNIAAIIINNQIKKGRPYKSAGLTPIQVGSNERTVLETKIAHFRWVDREYQSETPVVVMNARETQEEVQKYLKANKFFGLQDRLFTFAEEKMRALDPHTAEFIPLCFPTGDFDAVIGLFRNTIINELERRRTDFLFISEVANIGATLDPEILENDKQNKLIAEMIKREGFLRAIKYKDGLKMLLEKEEIDEETLSNPNFLIKFVPLRSTSTYWAHLDKLREDLRFSQGEFPQNPWNDRNFVNQNLEALRKIEELTIQVKYADENYGKVIAGWTPLSRLTHLLETSYLEVRSDRYFTLTDIERSNKQFEIDLLLNFKTFS